jgi:hypothetical protein
VIIPVGPIPTEITGYIPQSPRQHRPRYFSCKMDCLMRRLMQNAFALHLSIANRNKFMRNAKHDPF